MKCPKCKSENCQYIAMSETNSTGFNSGNACCGLILMGPMGLLCGLCGNETKTTTKEYWICQNCGNKFKADGQRYLENKWSVVENFGKAKHEVKFAEDIMEKDVLAKDTFWQKTQRGYSSYITGSIIEPYFLRKEPLVENPTYKRSKRKCAKELEEDSLIYCAVLEKEGLLITDKGIFVNDYVIRNNQLEAILCYEEMLYFNKIEYKLHSSEEAKILFEYLSFLFPGANSIKVYSYEQLVEEILNLKNTFSASEFAYNHQQSYKECVKRLMTEYIQCYQTLYPSNNYNEYERNRTLRKQLIQIIYISEFILAISLLFIIGLFGLLISAGIFIVHLFLINSNAWTKYKQLIPEEMVKIIEENECHLGGLSLLYYKKRIQDMKEQIIDGKREERIIRYCSKCGKSLNENWKNCPYCGNEKI